MSKEIIQSKKGDPGGGQLQGQREPVEPSADGVD